MERSALPDQIEHYGNWKKDAAKALKSYRLWMRRNQLFTTEADETINRLLDDLNKDHLTIAFAGEFSRGKTELINAIFFADYGQRVLPSQAGRTTMCPTELLYDNIVQAPYLRLLPIETRYQDTSLHEYRQSRKHWVEIDLPIEDPKGLVKAMANITETKRVPFDEAVALGFEKKLLARHTDRENYVEIPLWRHAIVSFPHPLLVNGLCILDTPGLNALGNEPELTINMLPSAQAVVFILGADAGVSASDLTIWEEHIKQLNRRPNLGLYAVLNKIDTMWDDLSDDDEIEKSIARIRKESASQLGISESAIIPLSAKQALLAKIRHDDELLEKSHIKDLENILAEDLLKNKHNLLWDSLVNEAGDMMSANTKLLQNRRQQLLSQKQELDTLKEASKEQIDELIHKTQEVRTALNRTLVTLKPSQKLMEKQMKILLGTISPEKLEQLILQTKKSLIKSKTTIGLLKGMRQFFDGLESMMVEYCHEAELSNKMADSLYRKFQQEHQLDLMNPRLLAAKKYRRQMEAIFHDAEQFNQTFITTLTEQSVAIRRFFSTTVTKILTFFRGIRQDCIAWSSGIVNPLMQQIKSNKDYLEHHLNDLKTMQDSTSTVRGRLKALEALIDEVERELEHASNLTSLIQMPHFGNLPENVVSFANHRR